METSIRLTDEEKLKIYTNLSSGAYSKEGEYWELDEFMKKIGLDNFDNPDASHFYITAKQLGMINGAIKVLLGRLENANKRKNISKTEKEGS